jgi:fibronectin type 3 domain-containing protein
LLKESTQANGAQEQRRRAQTTNTGLTNGTTYYYVVSAVNAAGESADSSQASATPQATVPTPPAAPTGLTVKATKPGSLDVRWLQSTTPGVTGYKIYRRTLSDTSSTLLTTVNATTSYRDSPLAGKPTYCYRVTAMSAGGESASSNEACATAK